MLKKPPHFNHSQSLSQSLIDVVVNIVIPVVVLSKFSSEQSLGPMWAFFLALSFPLCMSLHSLFFSSKKINIFNILGLLNVVITGGLGLLQLDGIWFAVKEASVPMILAIVLLISIKWKDPLIKRFILNDLLFDMKKINYQLQLKSTTHLMDHYLKNLNSALVVSFIVSSILNFFLAYILLKSPAGTAQFNQELAYMHLLSFPVISVPCLIVLSIGFYIFIKNLSSITDLAFEDLIALFDNDNNNSTDNRPDKTK